MKNKKGESHLGFILSFVIFITFLLFVYTTLEPALKIRASKQPVLDFLKFSFVDEIESKDSVITTINYKGDPSNPVKDCIQDEIGGTKLDGIITDANKNNLIIKDESGNVVDYDFQGGSKNFQMDMDPLNIRNSADSAIFKIYYSQSILSTTSPLNRCKQIDVNNMIDIGSLVEKQQVYESSILNFITQYETDYEKLKTDLDFPDGSDFTFSFELADGRIIEPSNVNIPSTDVYATTFPLEYLDSDANPQIGFLTIKVW